MKNSGEEVCTESSDASDSQCSLDQSYSSGLVGVAFAESCASLDFSFASQTTQQQCTRLPSLSGTPHPRARRTKAGELPPMSPPYRKRSSVSNSMGSPSSRSPRVTSPLARPPWSPLGKPKGILRRGVFHTRRSGSPRVSPLMLVRKAVKFDLPSDGLASLSNSFAEDGSIDLLHDPEDNYFKHSSDSQITRMVAPTLDALKTKNDVCAHVKHFPTYREVCSTVGGESFNDLSAGGGLNLLLSPDSNDGSSSSVCLSSSAGQLVPPFDPNGSCAFTYSAFELSDASSESPTSVSAYPDTIHEERPKSGEVDFEVLRIDNENPVDSVGEDMGTKLNFLTAV